MFNLFRRNCLYNESIEPHCAYCAHCKPDNEYQGVCEFRGIVAMAGSCRRFTYDALRRRPPKPARIRGRFSDADFFFEEKEPEAPHPATSAPSKQPEEEHPPLISEDLSQFADLWEDDDETPKTKSKPETNTESDEATEQAEQEKNASVPEETEEPKEEHVDEG